MHHTHDRFLVALLFTLMCVGSARAQDTNLSPANLTFGSQAVGTTSGGQTLTLTNPDDAHALAISSIVASSMFTETNTCGSSVAAGGSCTVTVHFAPTTAGAIDGSISISDDAPFSPQIVGLTGTGLAQETLSTTSFNFGTVTIGQTSQAEIIKLTNHTAAAIAISSIEASAGFIATPAATGGCGSTLAANSSCSESVVFAPTELGTISGSLIFSDAAAKQQYVALVGHAVGTAASPITLTPSTLNFGNQGVGTTSASKSVTIKNTGTSSLALTFAASGSYSKSNPATGACGSNLGAGDSCVIDVQFSPAVAGSVNGGVSVSYAGTDSPQVVSLSGTGIAPLTVSPSSIAFSSQQVGTTSAATKVTLTNNSNSAVSVSSIVTSNDFTETNTCGASIAKGASCTVSVSFAPTKGGSIPGSIVVTDSATNSPQLIDLSGTGYLQSRFAYVTNAYSNTISVYTVNVTTGQLRSNGYVFAGSFPGSVTVDPSGRFAYVANLSSNNISAYTINGSTGGLTPVTGSPYATETNPNYVAVDPSGRFVYVANQASNNISAYTIDAATGALTPVTGSPFASGLGPTPIVIDPSGRFLYVGNENDSPGGDISGYTINGTSGALTAMAGSPFLSGSGALTLAIAPSGKFGYVTAFGSPITAFSINPTTGVPGTVAGSPFNVSAGNSMVITASGEFMYVVEANTLNAYSVNTATGAISSITSVNTGSNPSSVSVDPTGALLYVTNMPGGEQSFPVNAVLIYSLAGNGTPTFLRTASTQQEPGSLAIAGGTAAVAYTPTFAYATNDDGNSVSGYAINAKTGALTSIAGSPFNTDAPSGSDPSPVSVAVDPTGLFAYVADFNGNGTTGYVSAYAINQTSGALSFVSGSPFAAGDNPFSVTVDPSGRFAYVANFFSNSISGYSIDSSTGGLTTLSGSPYSTGAGTDPISVTTDPSGQFLFVLNELTNQIESFSIDLVSGNLTAIGSVSTGSAPKLVAADPSGQFVYVANQGAGVSAYTISSTGALTQLSGSPFTDNDQPISVAVDPSGSFVYVANFNGASVSAFTLDLSTGALTEITGSPFAAGNEPQSVTVDISGNFVYVANSADNTVSAYTIDQTSGALTAISGSPFTTGSRPFAVATTGTIH